VQTDNSTPISWQGMSLALLARVVRQGMILWTSSGRDPGEVKQQAMQMPAGRHDSYMSIVTTAGPSSEPWKNLAWNLESDRGMRAERHVVPQVDIPRPTHLTRCLACASSRGTDASQFRSVDLA
jgi:hypothetical protein